MFPDTFSFIDAPDETWSAICDLVRAARDPVVRTISVDQRQCRQIDLGAEAVACAVAQAAQRQNRFSGTYPVESATRAIVRAVGLPAVFGLEPGDPRFVLFPLRKGTGGGRGGGGSAMAMRTAGRLIDYMDECLELYGVTLTDVSRESLGSLIGEIITNAEEHSGRRDWWVAAYLHQPEAAAVGDCHVTIFNFGMTLAESLQQLPERAKLRLQIEQLVGEHTRRSLWNPANWREDDLWTLYAIQGKVSRHNDGEDSVGDAGQGTADMIQAFQQLSGKEHRPRMCLLSGNTHIMFDDQFKMVTRDDGSRIIAFNVRNDLAERPHARYVSRVRRRFPGTLLSLRFYLDPVHLHDIAID